MRTLQDADLVGAILMDMGLSDNLKGYLYLRDAVLFSLLENDLLDELTKGMYPKIAHKNNTTCICVERTIRHAIEKAWKHSSEHGCGLVNEFTKKPTNGMLIRRLKYRVSLSEMPLK